MDSPPRQKPVWPNGKSFAFTVFDDADRDMMTNTRPVYDYLSELGFRTTKSVWMLASQQGDVNLGGLSCEDPDYFNWIKTLQQQGTEIGFHNARCHSSPRADTLRALERFKECFGQYPTCMANHFQNKEAIYWGSVRLSGMVRIAYQLSNLHRRHELAYEGHLPSSPYFWGDLCREKVRYVRNFVYREINTLKACPWMPYHDARMPFVNAWYASSEANNLSSFLDLLAEANQDRLAQEGGACIVYTHFGKKFHEDGALNPRFVELMRRLSKMNGWFVPLADLLDFLAQQHGGVHSLTHAERGQLQRRWFLAKLRHGSS